MSGKMMGGVWDLDLPHNKLIVLLAMADHADHLGGNIFPSFDLIAWKTGYSERQVRRVVKALVKDKILIETPRPGRTNLYKMNLLAGKFKEPYEKSKRANNPGQNVTPDTQMSEVGGHPDVRTTPDTQMSDEPSVKPSNNPLSAKKSRGASTKKAKRPAAEFNPIKDAIVAEFGWSWDTMSKVERGRVQKTAAQLYDAGRRAEDVPALYAYCKKHYTQFGPNALAGAVSEVAKQQAKTKVLLMPAEVTLPEPSDYYNIAGVVS